MDLTPVTLTGSIIRLEPLGLHHAAGLLKAAAYDEIWSYLDEPTPQRIEDAEALIRDAENEQANGARLPFATIDVSTGEVIGSISLIDIRQRDRAVEVGWAWLTPGSWRTGASRESVFMLMHHAFETMGTIRVAYKTDSRNVRSQNSILGIGAKQEGIFRSHRILSDGYVRDSIYYSVIEAEWPTVRDRYQAREAAGRLPADR
ncbi:GNAT family protein [Micromonospora sp. NPDC005291]|uniref:GNAT family N-acetyltransferase n=1 Tax=Micromonospora sp. NPDC005291 TaxID=3156872 RepID=UPI00339EE227